MEIQRSKIKWFAVLSDTSLIIEGVGICEEVGGEDSSWWKLQDHLEKNDLKIVGLGVMCDGKRIQLPLDADKYNSFRNVVLGSSGTEVTEYYTVVEAIYKNYTIQIWIDEYQNNINVKLKDDQL